MARRPHILFVTCHDLGRRLGCYGASAVQTPVLNELAAGGVRFANSFCTSPGCSPSRAAIATGRYPHCNGVLGLAHAHFGWELRHDERHVAALLGEAGFYPALFGLQHVTYNVDRLGFREVHAERPADAVAGAVERFLAGGPPQAPLYLEINFFEPHRPYDFGGVQEDRENGVDVPGYLPDTEATRAELALMQGAIRKVDGCIGRILESLRQAGILDETLVVFTSDHGIAFPRAKGTLYDAGIQTPLLMRWPAGGMIGGRVYSELVSNVDILPTLLELASTSVPSNVQGQSLAPLMSRGSYTPRDAVFAEKTFHNEYDPLRCIRTSRHKLIARFEPSNRLEVPADIMRGPVYVEMIEQVVQPGMPFELYDLETDPLERETLVARAETAELETDLKARLAAWMRETDDPLLKGPVASPFYHRVVAELQAAG
jgi:arylsulfatase A-like enzyme